MFNSYEFTFAGESCLMYGLMLYDIGGRGQSDVQFGNKGKIVESRTLRRVQPIHHGVSYNENPLTFKLIFGSESPLDRYELEKISFWLTGHQTYQWLSIDQPDLDNVQFLCLITDLTPISVGWLPYAFEATVLCDCPYAYGYPFTSKSDVRGTAKLLLRNDGSVREYVKPHIEFEAAGAGRLSIVNANDGGRQFLLENIPSGGRVVIDAVNGIIEEKTYGVNLYGGFNLNFLRLVPGDNELTVEGNGMLTLSGRFYHNVAG